MLIVSVVDISCGSQEIELFYKRCEATLLIRLEADNFRIKVMARISEMINDEEIRVEVREIHIRGSNPDTNGSTVPCRLGLHIDALKLVVWNKQRQITDRLRIRRNPIPIAFVDSHNCV
ncbi:hypothetical protein Z052_00130 [Halorubrum sp. C191]|nr:hypothetical protein Z052_00130 [Halorubrum sp. C191]